MKPPTVLLRIWNFVPETLRKWVTNCFVAFGSALPNAVISLITITVFSLVFHWSGWLSTAAYLIAQVFSLQYSVFFNSKTHMSFRIFGRDYHYSRRKTETRLPVDDDVQDGHSDA